MFEYESEVVHFDMPLDEPACNAQLTKLGKKGWYKTEVMIRPPEPPNTSHSTVYVFLERKVRRAKRVQRGVRRAK